MRRLLSIPILLVTLLALAAPAEAAFPGANGRISFGRTGEIHAINPDGGGETTLTADPNGDYDSRWSADGRMIAFLTYREFASADRAIYVMNADGSGARRVLYGGQHPAWSPDGEKIAFASTGGNFDIWSANVDGTGSTRLTDDFGIDILPAWSPDGQKIAFASNRGGAGYGVWVMNADGSAETMIVASAHEPSWSPDGTKIAFSRFDGDLAVWTMNADGSGQTKLVGSTSSSPAWSPDGTKIAFLRDLDPTSTFDGQLHVMNANGSGVHSLTGGGVTSYPDWQPLPAPSPAPPYGVPHSAASLRFSLVPVFRQCGSGGNPVNAEHSPPLATGSCNPPRPQGVALFGTQAEGAAWVTVIYGDTNAANGDQADATLRLDLTDIQTVAGLDYDPNPSGADATLVTRLRFTDTANGGSGSDSGTATDFDFSVPVACAATIDSTVGSDCRLDTSADAVTPGMIKERKTTVLQVYRLRLNDSGANGVRGDGDDRLFATEGVFVP